MVAGEYITEAGMIQEMVDRAALERAQEIDALVTGVTIDMATYLENEEIGCALSDAAIREMKRQILVAAYDIVDKIVPPTSPEITESSGLTQSVTEQNQ